MILACGGFEWNQELVRAFIGYDIQPLSPPHNTGDGLVMAMEAGARLGNMNSYWGQPAMIDPASERTMSGIRVMVKMAARETTIRPKASPIVSMSATV